MGRARAGACGVLFLSFASIVTADPVVLRRGAERVGDAAYDERDGRVVAVFGERLWTAEPWHEDPARRELRPVLEEDPGGRYVLAPGGRYALRTTTQGSSLRDELIDVGAAAVRWAVSRTSSGWIDYSLVAADARAIFQYTRRSATENRWVQRDATGSAVGDFALPREVPFVPSPDGRFSGWLEPDRFVLRDDAGRDLAGSDGAFVNAFIAEDGLRVVLVPDPSTLPDGRGGSLHVGSIHDGGRTEFDVLPAPKPVLWTIGDATGRAFYVRFADHTAALLRLDRPARWIDVDLERDLSARALVPRESLRLTSVAVEGDGSLTAVLTEPPRPWSADDAAVGTFLLRRLPSADVEWTALPPGRAAARVPEVVWAARGRAIVQGAEYVGAVDLSKTSITGTPGSGAALLLASGPPPDPTTYCLAMRAPLHTPEAPWTDLLATHELSTDWDGLPFMHGGFDIRGVAVDESGEVALLSTVVASIGGRLQGQGACGNNTCDDCEIQVQRAIPPFGSLVERYAHVVNPLFNPCVGWPEVKPRQCLAHLRAWPGCAESSHLHYQVVWNSPQGDSYNVAPDVVIDDFHDELRPMVFAIYLCDDDKTGVADDGGQPWQGCRPLVGQWPRGAIGAPGCIAVSEGEEIDVLARIEDVSLAAYLGNSYLESGLSETSFNTEIAPREIGYTLCEDSTGQCDPWSSIRMRALPSCLSDQSCDTAARVQAIHSFREPFVSKTEGVCFHDRRWYVLTNNDPDVKPLDAGFPAWAPEHHLDLAGKDGFHTLRVEAVDYSGNSVSYSVPLCVGEQWKLVVQDCPADNGAVPSGCSPNASQDLRWLGDRDLEVCFSNLGSAPTPQRLDVRARLKLSGADGDGVLQTERVRLDAALPPGARHCRRIRIARASFPAPALDSVLRVDLTPAPRRPRGENDVLRLPASASVSILRLIASAPE